MKTRQGFSSSSSFIIISKEKLTPEFIFSKIANGMSKNALFYNLVKETANIFYNNAKQIPINEILENYDYFYDQKVDALSQKTSISVDELNKLNSEAIEALRTTYEIITNDDILLRIKKIAKAMNVNFNFLYEVYKGESVLYKGEFNSYGNGAIEAMLCETDFDYADTNFYVHHDGGY